MEAWSETRRRQKQLFRLLIPGLANPEISCLAASQREAFGFTAARFPGQAPTSLTVQEFRGALLSVRVRSS